MRALSVAALICLVLAGCIGGPADPQSTTPEADVITDPTNTSYNDSSGFHIHDYWDGQDTKRVIEQTHGTFLNNLGGEDSRWIMRFHPGDGRVVPQGTSELTVTVDWTDDDPRNSYGDMELWVKPANANEARLVTEELEQGETVEVPIAYREADLPHQLISAWEFQVHLRGSSDPYNFYTGQVTVEGDAHRGYELRPFPPHPDHWGDETELSLVEETHSLFQFNNPTGGFTGNFDQRIRPPNGSLVPFETDRVEVTIESDNDLPVGGLELRYHGADTRNLTLLEPDSRDGSTATYTIPVTDEMADSPYVNASLWLFSVSANHGATDEPVYSGEFTLTATVYKR